MKSLNNNSDYTTNDYEDEDNIVINNPPLKEKMKAREIRARRSGLRKTKHFLAANYKLWLYNYLLGENSIPSMFISNKSANKDTFSLYDIICYSYLMFNKGEDGSPTFSNSQDLRKIDSLYTSVSEISTFKCDTDDNYNGELDIRDFKSYQTQAIRVIYKYLDFLFSRNDAKDLFKDGKSAIFNILDYGFFFYLLHESTKKQTNYLLKKKYDKISDRYYMMTFIGAYQLAQYHDIGVTTEEIINMWRDEFGVKWAAQSESHIYKYILNNLFGLEDNYLIECVKEFEREKHLHK